MNGIRDDNLLEVGSSISSPWSVLEPNACLNVRISIELRPRVNKLVVLGVTVCAASLLMSLVLPLVLPWRIGS